LVLNCLVQPSSWLQPYMKPALQWHEVACVIRLVLGPLEYQMLVQPARGWSALMELRTGSCGLQRLRVGFSTQICFQARPNPTRCWSPLSAASASSGTRTGLHLRRCGVKCVEDGTHKRFHCRFHWQLSVLTDDALAGPPVRYIHC